MDRIGDDYAGFSVGYDPGTGKAQVTAWGFWSIEVANVFTQKVTASLRDRPGTRELVLDMRDLKPMRDEGQRSFANLVKSLPGLGIARMVVITTSHLTKIQLLRIVTENDAGTEIAWS